MKERTYRGEMTMEELSGYINSSTAPFSILIPLGNDIDTEDFRSMDKAYRDPAADDGEPKRISSPGEVSVHE